MEGIPLNLSIADISAYIDAYDPPLARYELDACVLALDDKYIADALAKRKTA